MKIKLLILSSLLIGGLCLPQLVLAQVDQAQLKTESQKVLTQYRSELQDYQRTYNAYQLAKSQHEQLDTLSSLEAAVRTTQAVMLDRAEVLRTYLALLRLNLIMQPGVSLVEKDEVLHELENQIGILDKEIEQYSASFDRVQLTERAQIFAGLIVPIEEVGHHALSLLAIGELQTIYDKAQALSLEIKTVTATTGGALKIEQKQRSFDEINRSFNLIGEKFDEIETDLINNSDKVHHYQQNYERVKEDLAAIFTSLSRAVSFLGEILSI